jgi:hypoxanthine phosphoribosyltransferase
MNEISKKILFPGKKIQKRVREIADQISADFTGHELILIGVLKGSFIFMSDLIRQISIPCSVDFVRAASYGEGSESSGKVAITKDIETSIKGRNVLIVEDIIDTGLTLQYLFEYLKDKNPNSLKICAFLDKRKRRQVPVEADYVGFTIDDGFVVGYGLDFNEQYRSLPDVYVIQQQERG